MGIRTPNVRLLLSAMGRAMGRARDNVVLTGFMGTGKSTVGRILAGLLEYEFVDTDTAIEDRHGPIPDIFAAHGEAVFREYELAIAKELARQERLVIGTGGGLMLQPDAAKALDETGTVFCLTASVDTILERVISQQAKAGSPEAQRPLLAGSDPRQRVTDLLNARRAQYSWFTQVTTEGRSPDEVAAEIVVLLG